MHLQNKVTRGRVRERGGKGEWSHPARLLLARRVVFGMDGGCRGSRRVGEGGPRTREAGIGALGLPGLGRTRTGGQIMTWLPAIGAEAGIRPTTTLFEDE